MIRHLLLASGLVLVTGTSALAGLPRHQPHLVWPSDPALAVRIIGIVDSNTDHRHASAADARSQNRNAAAGIPDSHSGYQDEPLLGLNDSSGNDPRTPLPARDHWSF